MLPAGHVLEQTYFDRMGRGIGEKIELVKHAVPGTVLNVGAGGPELSLAFQDAGHRVLSLDASLDSCERLANSGLETIQGNAEEMDTLVTGSVHNIVFSSILHEVFSYASGDGRDAIRGVLRQAFEMLEPGGRILIRDGVKSRGDCATLVTETEEMRELVEDYISHSPLIHKEVSIGRVGRNHWSGSLSSVLEILNTVNWGRGSLPREMCELFGVFTASEYIDELAAVGFNPVRHTSCVKTYQKHLEGKAHALNIHDRVLWLPPTATWVGIKPMIEGRD